MTRILLLCLSSLLLQNTYSNDSNNDDSSSNGNNPQAEKNDSSGSSSSSSDNDECTVWLAPSTIPGAGLGMYAGKPFGLWEPIGLPDLVIPVVDYYAHNPKHDGEFIFDYYGWNVWSFPNVDVEGTESITFCPGAGAALNCMLSLVNTVAEDDDVLMDQVGMHRSKDPGVGAFTPFYNRQLISRGGIEEGDELFDSYGEAYFSDREDLFGKIPLTSEDHEEADEFLETYVNLKKELCDAPSGSSSTTSSSSSNSISVTSSRTTGHCGLHSDFYRLMTKLSSLWPSRALNALPQDPNQVDEIAELGTAYTHNKRSQRSLAWLRENGECMDHLEIKPSTNPQAGRGAFARRDLKAGQLAAPGPAIHVKREILNMYPFVYRRGKPFANTTGLPHHAQLLLNYCWGHRHSSILVCPYGSVSSTINHSKENANVKLEWNKDLMRHPEWLNMPLSEWVNDLHAGLMFNYVTIRDIKKGEEVWIDYGEEWETAWNQHVRYWQPPKDADKYVDAIHMNEQEEVLRTVSEGNYYDETYVQLYCRDIYRIWQGLVDYEEERAKFPCRVLSRTEGVDGEMYYTAEIYSNEVYSDKSEIVSEEVIFNVPRDAFYFADKLFTRDHAQPWAFRHDARIPDDIFPEAWKDWP